MVEVVYISQKDGRFYQIPQRQTRLLVVWALCPSDVCPNWGAGSGHLGPWACQPGVLGVWGVGVANGCSVEGILGETQREASGRGGYRVERGSWWAGWPAARGSRHRWAPRRRFTSAPWLPRASWLSVALQCLQSDPQLCTQRITCDPHHNAWEGPVPRLMPQGSQEAFKPVNFCPSGEDRLAKGSRLHLLRLHYGRCVPHIALDGKLGGLVQPHDGQCHLNGGQRAHGVQLQMVRAGLRHRPATLPRSAASPSLGHLSSGPLLTDFPILSWDWVSIPPPPTGLPELLLIIALEPSLKDFCGWFIFLLLCTHTRKV